MTGPEAAVLAGYTLDPCAAHKTHRPGPQYNEKHHVIPQAWQRFEGIDRLFDARTVALCPTGHRNVHFWIVRVMKTLPSKVLDDPSADRAAFLFAQRQVREQARRERRVINPHEWQIACLAPQRWLDHGGTFAALVKAGQWGQS